MTAAEAATPEAGASGMIHSIDEGALVTALSHLTQGVNKLVHPIEGFDPSHLAVTTRVELLASDNPWDRMLAAFVSEVRCDPESGLLVAQPRFRTLKQWMHNVLWIKQRTLERSLPVALQFLHRSRGVEWPAEYELADICLDNKPSLDQGVLRVKKTKPAPIFALWSNMGDEESGTATGVAVICSGTNGTLLGRPTISYRLPVT